MMNQCSTYPCLRTTAGCPVCDPTPNMQALWGPPLAIWPTPSPRMLPVNVPFSNFGITIVTLDQDGNLTIKVDQPVPAQS